MRKVTKKERDLIAFLLQNHHNKEKLITQLNHAMVENMNDGNMGSLRFLNEDENYFGEQIAEITLLDTDKVPVFPLLLTLIKTATYLNWMSSKPIFQP